MPSKVRFKDGPDNLTTRWNGDLSTSTAASARADLLFTSVTSGTKGSYSSQFGHWVVWRRARGDPLLLDPLETAVAWEDEMADFYCHGGSTCGYAPATMHVRLSAVRRFHRLICAFTSAFATSPCHFFRCCSGDIERATAPPDAKSR